jgi:HSP20 family molecular chaperone IbpA
LCGIFTVPDTVDAEHVKADYEAGVLTITPSQEGSRQAQSDQSASQ